LLIPNPNRLSAMFELLRRGHTANYLYDRTFIDPWFLYQLAEIVAAEKEIQALPPVEEWKWETWREIKRIGFSDDAIAHLTGSELETVRSYRQKHHSAPVYKTVDTCAAEFEAYTPYHYSTYEWEDEVREGEKDRV